MSLLNHKVITFDPSCLTPSSVSVSDHEDNLPDFLDDPTKPGIGTSPIALYPRLVDRPQGSRPLACHFCSRQTLTTYERSESDHVPCCPICAIRELGFAT